MLPPLRGAERNRPVDSQPSRESVHRPGHARDARSARPVRCWFQFTADRILKGDSHMFFSSWSRYFTSQTKQRKLLQARKPLALSVEPLEERALLSGNPPVVLIAGPADVTEGTA